MIGSDDPRLTAYAVDEVDAETAAAVEQTLRDSASARAAVNETEEAARLLSAAFAAEASPALRNEQRQSIEDAAARPTRPSKRWHLALWGGLAAALAFILLWPQRQLRTPDQRITRATSAPAQVLPIAVPPTVASAAPSIDRPASPRTATAHVPASEQIPAPSSPRPATTTATLRGVVLDESGAVIPGATILVRSVETGDELRATTGAAGDFRLTDLSPGRFDVRAELTGFMPSTRQMTAAPGAVVAWTPTLHVGAMTETIMVEGKNAMLMASVADSSRLAKQSMSMPRRQMAAGVSGGVVGGVVGGIPMGERRIYAYDQDAAGFNTEAYGQRTDNALTEVKVHPLSTFSLDVDTASYSNVRRFLMEMGQRPPADAVRIEELINYFPYDYPAPTGDERFAAHLEIAPAPWKPEHRLLRIGLKTPELDLAHRPAGNLVFLIDVSGSMNVANKLPLVKESLRLLVDKLNADDHVAMAVYAGAAGLVLDSTPGDQKQTILAAIDRLQAGGSTNGAAGIQLAYQQATEHFVRGGINRVILATDGDFNVGLTHEGGLARLIQEKAANGVFLSVLGFGMGNLKDSTMEMLADKGNGNYAYIDTLREARKALVEQMAGTLVTVAKDVKIQVEFNPAQVRAYRLIGYENRLLRPEDFKDDKKDAGEVGAGHTVTALYELVPANGKWNGPKVDALRYQSSGGLTPEAQGGELLRLKLRYKEPEGSKSRLQEWTLVDRDTTLAETSADFRFASAVAAFGMLLRDAPDKGQATFATVLDLAQAARGNDPSGYRAEFIELVKKAQALSSPTFNSIQGDVIRP